MNRYPVQQIHNNNNNVPLKSLRFISTIMSLLLIISIACSLLVRLRAIEHRPPRLEISSPSSSNDPRDFANFTFSQHTTWILTCRVIPTDRFPPFNITLVNERSTRLAHSNFSNSVTLPIINATDADSGEYKCTAYGPGHRMSVKANVRVVKATPCGKPSFSCGNLCIYPRFLCDGVPDCADGSDEDPVLANCTSPPCDNKQWCGERCIPPHWCCTPGQDDCSVQHVHPCCPNNGFSDISELRRRDDGFLETTIYVVIGCSTAFLVLLIVLVVAICRFHMKRTPVTRHPRAPMNLSSRIGVSRPPGTAGMGDFDVYLNQALLDLSQHSGLLVTYNINSGVQLMGRPVDPPPYCEVVSPPPRGGPPPPYAPRENMRLQTEEGEDAGIAEDDALLRGPPDLNRPISNDCPPPVSHFQPSYSIGAGQDSVPCGSNEAVPTVDRSRVGIPGIAGLTFQERRGKRSGPSLPCRERSVSVSLVTDESAFKQIRSTSLPVDEKDSAG